MATFTDNFALTKPTYGELADVAVINGNMDTIDGIMHSNRTMLAPAFSQTEDYAVGDVVVYEGNLYRFIVPHTAGNWDGTEVEQTTLGEEVATKGGADVTKTATGNPIEFEDGADAPLVKCTTAITGSQDLHGYDKPWVGGAGKNKLPLVLADIKSANTSGTWSGNAYTISDVTLTILTDDDGNITGIKANGTATSNITFSLTLFNASYMTDGMTYKVSGSIGGSYSTWCIWVVSHGTIISEMSLDGDGTFTYSSGQHQRVNLSIDRGVTVTNQMFYPMIRLATVTDSTFEPYSNICPITAYTEGEIEVRGKNRIPESGFVQGILGWDTDADTYTANNAWITSPYIEINSTDSFVLSAIKGKIVRLYVTDENHNKLSFVGNQPTEGASYTISPTTNAKYIRFTIGADGGTYTPSDYGTTLQAQLEEGTATTYEPYKATTHTTTYPSAIYRGSEDVVNGSVKTIKKKVVFDGSNDENWQLDSSMNRFFIEDNTLRAKPKSAAISNLYENKVVNYWGELANGQFAIHPSTNYMISLMDSRFSSVSDLRTAFATIPLEIAYEIETESEDTVTPTNLPIKSLFGYNHIESSTGEMEVEYITEEFQPIVDLIESGNGHTYSTSEQIVGKWIDGSTLYQKTIIFDNVITLTSDTFVDVYDLSTLGVKDLVELTVYTENTTPYRPFTHYFTDITSANILRLNAVSNGWYIGGMTIRYTKTTTPTRSLNLTKSAVTEKSDSKEELPDEIKNAPFEEKPDYNEADDDAPTEEQER